MREKNSTIFTSSQEHNYIRNSDSVLGNDRSCVIEKIKTSLPDLPLRLARVAGPAEAAAVS